MGTFGGHIVPGSCFILISLWWCYSIYHNYFKSKCNGTRYRSTTSFRLEEYPNFPLESLVKLLLVVIGITGETVTGFDDQGVFVHLVNAQHITMFFFFGIQAVVEILQFYNFPPVPLNAEYFTSVLGFFAEGLLFYFHLHGRSPIDVLVHTLLIVAIAGCCISVFVEMFIRNSVMATLSRTFWMMVQGTWFYNIAFILYPPLPGMKHWADGDHKEMMLVTMYFTWHCAANFGVILVIGGLVFLRYRHRLGNCRENGMLRLSSFNKSLKSECVPLNQIDSDSDGI